MKSIGRQLSATLARAMSDAKVAPLWVHYRELNSLQPDLMEPPMLWRWAELEAAINGAADEVSMADAERRALILANPSFAPKIQTTWNLIAAVQILNPGDRAGEHRHTMAAIRMIIEAEGGITSVDGQEFEMHRGDLVLTPAGTWHAHANTTRNRLIWIDGLDVPLVRNSLDAAFFDPHAPESLHNSSPLPADRWKWVESGLATTEMHASLVPFSPRMHYPWPAASAMLDRLPSAPDGSITLRYVHPQTGGAVMPTIDCFMHRLSRNQRTRTRRSTSNAICIVLEGEGSSQIGDATLSWAKNDIFTIPHWTWASHCSGSERSHLFVLTDRELFRRLDLLREEMAEPTSSEARS